MEYLCRHWHRSKVCEIKWGRLKIESVSLICWTSKTLFLSFISFCMWRVCQDCPSCSWAVPKISIFFRLCIFQCRHFVWDALIFFFAMSASLWSCYFAHCWLIDASLNNKHDWLEHFCSSVSAGIFRKMVSDITGYSWQAGHVPATRSSLLLLGTEACCAVLAEEAFKGELKAVLYRKLGREVGLGWLWSLIRL